MSGFVGSPKSGYQVTRLPFLDAELTDLGVDVADVVVVRRRGLRAVLGGGGDSLFTGEEARQIRAQERPADQPARVQRSSHDCPFRCRR